MQTWGSGAHSGYMAHTPKETYSTVVVVKKHQTAVAGQQPGKQAASHE